MNEKIPNTPNQETPDIVGDDDLRGNYTLPSVMHPGRRLGELTLRDILTEEDLAEWKEFIQQQKEIEARRRRRYYVR